MGLDLQEFFAFFGSGKKLLLKKGFPDSI